MARRRKCKKGGGRNFDARERVDRFYGMLYDERDEGG
jgi:hypothetical protein